MLTAMVDVSVGVYGRSVELGGGGVEEEGEMEEVEAYAE
jgi:hypothetical protein